MGRNGFDHRPNLSDRCASLVTARCRDPREIIGGVEILGVVNVDPRAIAALVGEPSVEWIVEADNGAPVRALPVVLR